MNELSETLFNVFTMIFAMGWQILWGLVLGFLFSALIDVLVSKAELQKLLPDASAKSLIKATALGAASSSCSYAAVAIARSIFRKGANFTAAMAFAFASTNLVIELGVLLVVFMGWRFAVAEFLGGPLMIMVMALLFRFFLRPTLIKQALVQAQKGISGNMEGHASMETGMHQGSWKDRLTSGKGWTTISHYFVMNWSMLWRDIVLGLVVSGLLAVLVPHAFWQAFFLTEHPILSKVWGPVVGPIIALLSFTCSIGNIPLAAVLWNGGISFGGVIAFIFGDLIILPILNIYRKYYGSKMSLFLMITFYVSMVVAAFIIDLLFEALSLIPARLPIQINATSLSWNYTTFFNCGTFIIAGILYVRYRKTGGPAMMRSMNAETPNHHHHGC